MKTKRFLICMVVATAVIGLVACAKPASTGPGALISTDTNFPVPATKDMNALITETSVAEQVQNTPLAVTNTPVPVQPIATQVVVPTATPGHPTSYKLQKGEFPYCIARRFNVNPNDLLSQNGLNSKSATYPGQELKIPQSGSWPGERSLHKHPASYKVGAGDTIYSIACYFGDVDPMAIAQANGLKDPYTLKVGDSISIP